MRQAIAILAAVLALSGAAGLRPASAEKYALMIGVNEYASERIPDLRGCHNDVDYLKAVLLQKYGFRETNVRVILSQDATKERILKEFDNHLGQAGPNDVVYFHFSGHGSQAPDDNGDEEDGIDETFCPTDIRTDRQFRDVRDDEFGAAIAKLRAGSITIILDSCHSGTATRGLDDFLSPTSVPPGMRGMTTGNRFVEPTEPVVPTGIETNGLANLFQRPPGLGSRGMGGVAARASEPSFTFLSGCRAEQTSADAPFATTGGKYAYFGALSYNLAGALMKADPNDPSWTMQRVVETAIASMKARSFKQDPQIEAPANVRLFWQRPAPPVATPTTPVQPTPTATPPPSKPFILVTNLGGNQVELGAGAAAGVTEQSVYTIYEATDNKLEGTGIALAQVRVVGPTTCVAELKRADAAKLKKGCRAVETLHYYPPNKLYVALAGVQVGGVKAALQGIPFVSVVDSLEDYVDRVVRIEAGAGGFRGHLINMDGQRFETRTGANAPALVEALREDLTNAYVIKRLALLQNPAPPFRVKAWVEGDQPPKKLEGEKIVFKFRAERDCYLNLIDCGTSGKVTVLFPNAFHKDNRIQAGREYAIPSDEMGFDIETQGPAGLELVKAVATVKPLNLLGFDFSTLAQDRPFLTRDLDESVAAPAQMEVALSRSLGGDLAGGVRGKDFVIKARPAATAPPSAGTIQVVAPTKPPEVFTAQPIQPVKPTPVEVTPEYIPTDGWATDVVIVAVKGKGV
ncbi:MAG: caspase family protein [Armatimonadetes bacterium]|nr:caspase family protein [Armatimonadota bacterium]